MEEQLKCSVCQEHKDKEEFPKATKKKRGYAWECKQCKKEKVFAKKATMSEEEWRLHNRKYYLKCQYNVTQQYYDSLVKEQNHKCAICGTDEVDSVRGVLHIDHCHATGKLRGLLCQQCNTALGKFKDSEEILEKAKEYLRKYK